MDSGQALQGPRLTCTIIAHRTGGACTAAQEESRTWAPGEHQGRVPALEGPGHCQTPVGTSCAAGSASRWLNRAMATFQATVLGAHLPCIEASPRRFPERGATTSPCLLSFPTVASVGRGSRAVQPCARERFPRVSLQPRPHAAPLHSLPCGRLWTCLLPAILGKWRQRFSLLLPAHSALRVVVSHSGDSVMPDRHGQHPPLPQCHRHHQPFILIIMSSPSATSPPCHRHHQHPLSQCHIHHHHHPPHQCPRHPEPALTYTQGPPCATVIPLSAF